MVPSTGRKHSRSGVKEICHAVNMSLVVQGNRVKQFPQSVMKKKTLCREDGPIKTRRINTKGQIVSNQTPTLSSGKMEGGNRQ